MKLLCSAFLLIAAAGSALAEAPRIYADDGTYLGRLSANKYDSESVSNEYGRYGSPYSSTSINNPYSRYGSPYSSHSARNPYATSAPVIVSPSPSIGSSWSSWSPWSSPSTDTKCSRPSSGWGSWWR